MTTKKKGVAEPEPASITEPEAALATPTEQKPVSVGDFRFLIVRDDATVVGGAQDAQTASRFADEAAVAGACTTWVCEVGARHT